MKRFLGAFCALSLFACNNAGTSSMTEAQPFVPADMHGFTPEYSASFIMDSAKNTESVLALWRVWQDGDLSKALPYFADSVTFINTDGSVQSGPTEEIIKGVQAYRNSFKSMNTSIGAIFATKSTDRNEHWVGVWGSEIRTDSTGKVDSVSLMESWRFNSEGKSDMMFQYMRKGIQPPPPPVNQ